MICKCLDMVKNMIVNPTRIMLASGLLVIIVVFIIMLVNRKRVIKMVSKEGFETPRAVCSMYYTNWCGYSKRALPEYKKLINTHHGKKINGVSISIKKIDCEKKEGLCKENNIKGYPTIILSQGNKKHTYKGERTHKSMKEWLEGIL